MIMYKNNIPLVSQEVIGNALGLTVPKEDAFLFENPRTGKRPVAGWGTQIYNSEFSPNVAFDNLHIPLSMELHLIDEFNSVEQIGEFLARNEHANADILVCYDYGTLFSTDLHIGHVNVFDSYNQGSGVVRLVDPEQRVPKYRQVKIEKLFSALIAHGNEKSGGFWEFARRARESGR